MYWWSQQEWWVHLLVLLSSSSSWLSLHFWFGGRRTHLISDSIGVFKGASSHWNCQYIRTTTNREICGWRRCGGLMLPWYQYKGNWKSPRVEPRASSLSTLYTTELSLPDIHWLASFQASPLAPTHFTFVGARGEPGNEAIHWHTQASILTAKVALQLQQHTC